MDGRAEPRQRRAALRDAQRLLAVEEIGEPPGFMAQDVGKVGQFPDRLLRRQTGERLSIGLQERAGVGVESGCARGVPGRQPIRDLRRLRGIRRAAALQRRRGPLERGAVEPPFGAGLGVERRLARVFVEAGIVVQAADRSRNRRLRLSAGRAAGRARPGIRRAGP